MFSNIKDNKTKKLGLDKLQLMGIFMGYLGDVQDDDGKEKSIKVVEERSDRLKLEIEEFIGRKLSDVEEIGMLKSLANYFGTEAETQERLDAMSHFFDLMFLKD